MKERLSGIWEDHNETTEENRNYAGKKQIAAVVLAVILAVAAGIPHSMVYAEPDSTGNAQAADAAADDTQKEEKKKKT